jgi:adenosyl cobinamide kinase/adenosyl cobinamide phosphate guanylyltransferase
MTRAISLKTLYELTFNEYEFTGVWLDVLGKPEKGKVWLIYGDEKNGKTLFALKLAEYLSQFESVYYISAEEGTGKSFQQNAQNRAKMDIKKTNVKFLGYTELDDVEKILSRRKPPKTIFFDNMTVYNDELAYGRFKKFTMKYPKTTLVFIAHEERGEPYTATAKLCKRLARYILRVKGMTAFVSGSCPGGTIIIDEESALLCHGSQIKN